MKSFCLFPAIIALTGALPATAQVVTSRSDFTAKTSGVSTVDFNQFSGSGAAWLAPGTSLGGVSFSNPTTYGLGAKTSNFASGTAYGSGYLEWQGDDPSLMTITLPTSATAVAFDFMALLGTSAPFTFAVNGQSFVRSSGSAPSFFGFLSDTPFTTLTISASRNTFPTIDNFSFGVAAVTSAVPEPATWGMMILGFGVIGAGMRRRQAVTSRVTYA